MATSLSKAEKIALIYIYKDHHESVYCGCSFNSSTMFYISRQMDNVLVNHQ